MEGLLEFKRFRIDDINILYNWANDPETRMNSFHSDKIVYDEHVKWCETRLDVDNIAIYIVYKNDIPVGQLRLEYVDKKAYISYSVDKRYRGIGLGKKIIESIEKNELYKGHHIIELIGEVKEDNLASQKVFEYCLYTKYSKNNRIVFVKRLIK